MGRRTLPFHRGASAAYSSSSRWGRNMLGEFGSGAQDGGSKVPVLGAGGKKFKSIYRGFGHTCGLTAEGEAWCWGFFGALADGTTDLAVSPRRVGGLLLFISLE